MSEIKGEDSEQNKFEQARLGISHALPKGSTVVHSTVLGDTCLGRIIDLMSAWCKREVSTDSIFISNFRLLMLALLEFSCPKTEESLGQIELAQTGDSFIVATRFPSRNLYDNSTLSKDLTQYWLNSEEVKLLKRMLQPNDRVEVRYHRKLKLIEWRVCRPLSAVEVTTDHSESFLVFADKSEVLLSSDSHYQDLGDLPFQDWLSEAYHNRTKDRRAGDVNVEACEVQDEEWDRVVADREKKELEYKISIQAGNLVDTDQNLRIFAGENSANSEDEFVVRSQETEFDQSSKSFKGGSEETDKKSHGTTDKDKMLQEQMLVEMELLLKKKEYVNQRQQKEMKELQQKLEDQKKNHDTGRSDHFRLKAMEMFEMLKKLKEEKLALERSNTEYRRQEKIKGDEDEPGPSASNQKHVEEVTKRMERLQRTLEAEKLKVKTLSERVVVAEKEAQSAGPIISDLEARVEHTFKVSQQSKKETETVKQKLVQTEAEKNKIANDLVKVQAQVQTLMKRQAG